MASYWVSQERYFCKYCKVWLSNHQASIRNHDQGKKHVEIVAEFFRKKREDKLKGAQSESDLKRQMERIEQAALRAHEKDMGMFGGAGAGSGSASASSTATPPPPPPPPAPTSDVPPPPPPLGGPPPAPSRWKSDSPDRPPPPPGGPSRSASNEEAPPPPPPPRGPSGVKTEDEEGGAGAESGPVSIGETPPPPPPPRRPSGVKIEDEGGGAGAGPGPASNGQIPPPPPPRGKPSGVKTEEGWVGAEAGAGVAWGGVLEEGGQWFLDGQVHEDKLAVDSACQIFASSEGQWVDAVVLSIEPASSANRRFEVAYFEAGAEKETVLQGVEASALRLPAGEGGAWPPPPEMEPLPPPPPPDDNTGLGGWQTVSVRLVNEAAETEARRRKKEIKRAKKQKREEKTEREMMLVEAMDADDAMGSYDPWGTGKYKGFEIKKEEPRGPEGSVGGGAVADGGQEAGPVSFKKRKGPGNKGKFRKKAREDD